MANKQVSDETAIKIALARFGPLAGGNGETQVKDIAHEFNLSKNTITAAIRSAFQKKLVEVRRVERDDLSIKTGSRNLELEAALRDRFPSLASAIVVESTEVSSDRVHRDIGYAMARELGNHIDDDTIVGIGSGRGPYYTVEGARKLTRLSRERVTLMSLTGDVYPQAHQGELNALLDADFHTALFSTSFSKPITQRMISSTIAHLEVDAVRKKTWLDPDEYQKHTPTVAIVGVGVLKNHHRFYREVAQTSADAPRKHVLEPIREFLVELKKFSDNYSTNTYSPVADVCNRLMFVESPTHAIASKDESRIRMLIEATNTRLLTIDPQQLADIRGLLLVAGTAEKATAIRKLLFDGENQPGAPRIRTVCTDTATANIILNR